MRKFALTLLLAAIPAAAQAQSMTVADFLARAEALERKGALALFSSDLKLLKAQMQNSGKQLRAEQVAAQKAGRKPATCLPAKASMESDELLRYFRSIPPQQRSMTVKAGLAGFASRKFPCNG